MSQSPSEIDNGSRIKINAALTALQLAERKISDRLAKRAADEATRLAREELRARKEERDELARVTKEQAKLERLKIALNDANFQLELFQVMGHPEQMQAVRAKYGQR